MQLLTRAGAVEVKPHGVTNQIPTNIRNNLVLDRVAYHHLKGGSTNNEDWLEKKKNSLMVVAVLIATMAFQAGVNPPSGVWQENYPQPNNDTLLANPPSGIWQENSTNIDPPHKAGYSIMASNKESLYHIFLICNTVGFVSTFSIILLLISGLPFIKHRVFLWLLMVIMWIATTSMYRWGLDWVDDSFSCRTHSSANWNYFEGVKKSIVAKKEDLRTPIDINRVIYATSLDSM
ncbi:ankyrin repeat-containing domain, PGG domain protein [Tanacetum coccineum]